ncbi:MAG: SagB/ThcOx family dehydrogenase [Spirochaetales bacterium]
MDDRFLQGRHFLKSNWHFVKETQSDQSKGLPTPLQELPPESDDSVVALPPVEEAYGTTFGSAAASAVEPGAVELDAVELDAASALHSLLKTRQSRRMFRIAALSLAELSYLLWSCEGVRENKGKFSFRTTPSGGARHPLDVYIFSRAIEGLKPGLYRYLPLEHSLVLEREGDDSPTLDKALMGQLLNSACVVFWAAVPYRSEWRYGKAADKLVALDAGHSCQNLYLACEALGLGTCAIGKYDQTELDKYLGLDGEDMFAMYAAIVGKPAKKE